MHNSSTNIRIILLKYLMKQGEKVSSLFPQNVAQITAI